MVTYSRGAHATAGRRYIIDITDMIRVAHDRKGAGRKLSGVPRTLLQLASYACRMRPDMVRVGYFDNVRRQYCELPNRDLLSDFEQLRTFLRKAVEYKRQFKTWKYHRSSVSYYYHSFRRIAAHYAARLKRFLDSGLREEAIPLDLCEGDLIVCLGGSWDSLDLLRYLEEEELVGPAMADLAVMVYDVIPLQMKVTGVVPSLHFEYWLHQVCRLNAKALVNTNSTASDLRDWCYRHGYDHIKIGQFPLGDEPPQIGGADIRGEVRSLIKQRYVLMVGPFTGRKNGRNLIRAWRAMSERIPAENLPLLVIAGREGRANLSECGLDEATVPTSSIIFLTAPNDSELRQLYENCMFTVFPSLYEGWGLPVGESLWHGKICATSSRSSLPEVGGDDCEYFNPDDPRDIARVLRRLIADPDYLAERTGNIDRSRLRTWKHAAEELLTTLDAFAVPPAYQPDAPAHVGGMTKPASASPLHPG